MVSHVGRQGAGHEFRQASSNAVPSAVGPPIAIEPIAAGSTDGVTAWGLCAKHPRNLEACQAAPEASAASVTSAGPPKRSRPLRPLAGTAMRDLRRG